MEVVIGLAASILGLFLCLLSLLLLRGRRRQGILLERNASFVPPIKLKRRTTQEVIGKPFDVFLSYRVASDRDSVEALYHALTAEGLRVWWDKECLKTGEKWEEGFMDGLIDSVVAVPLLSCDLLRTLAGLQPDAQDNVLIEHSFCLELFERGELKGIVPLLIGSLGPSTYNNFFIARVEAGSECTVPDVVLPSVNGLLKKHMRRKGKGIPMSKAGTTATAREIVGELLEFQGIPLQGEGPSDFVLAAASIAKVVRDIKSRPGKSLKKGARWKISTPRMSGFSPPATMKINRRSSGLPSRSSGLRSPRLDSRISTEVSLFVSPRLASPSPSRPRSLHSLKQKPGNRNSEELYSGALVVQDGSSSPLQ